MQHQEKKFRVSSFEGIKNLLQDSNSTPTQTSTSTHYYAQLTGPGVTKLVIYGDTDAAIHILDEADGKFTLREDIPVNDKQAGMQWLKDHNFNLVSKVQMTHADYPYKSGIVGLYTINDLLLSVILDYPPGQHEDIERELGLEGCEVIAAPYNVYLQQLGLLQPKKLNELD